MQLVDVLSHQGMQRAAFQQWQKRSVPVVRRDIGPELSLGPERAQFALRTEGSFT